MSIINYTRNVTGCYREGYGTNQNLITNAERLIRDMKCHVPVDGLTQGQVHVLEPLMDNGAPSCTITVCDTYATFVNLSVGVVVSVDNVDRRRTSSIGRGR